MKRFDLSLRLILILTLFVATTRWTRKITDGFTIATIHSQYPYNPNWEVQNPPLPDVFDQRFTFLGSGGQCFAFLSEDGTYVLKFFKNRLNRVLPWQKGRKLKLEKKLSRDFASYKLAMEKLPEDTGLLYVHLNKTDSLQKRAHIVDKLGIEHQVDLDQVDFILQRRAEMTYPHLLQLVQNNDLAGAKEAIDSICHLIIGRCQKGIHDEDAKIHRNCGFIGNRAIIIDVGRFKEDPRRIDPAVQRSDFAECTQKLNRYLEEISPELAQYFEENYAKTLH